MRIVVSHVFPPIPCREFDYCVFEEGEEEKQMYGYGRTAAQALRDFADRLEDEQDARTHHGTIYTYANSVKP